MTEGFQIWSEQQRPSTQTNKKNYCPVIESYSNSAQTLNSKILTHSLFFGLFLAVTQMRVMSRTRGWSGIVLAQLHTLNCSLSFYFIFLFHYTFAIFEGNCERGARSVAHQQLTLNEKKKKIVPSFCSHLSLTFHRSSVLNMDILLNSNNTRLIQDI